VDLLGDYFVVFQVLFQLELRQKLERLDQQFLTRLVLNLSSILV
jgi:hypothetical protein